MLQARINFTPLLHTLEQLHATPGLLKTALQYSNDWTLSRQLVKPCDDTSLYIKHACNHKYKLPAYIFIYLLSI